MLVYLHVLGWVLVAALGWVSQGRAHMVGRGGSVVPRDVLLARCHHVCVHPVSPSALRCVVFGRDQGLGRLFSVGAASNSIQQQVPGCPQPGSPRGGWRLGKHGARQPHRDGV